MGKRMYGGNIEAVSGENLICNNSGLAHDEHV